MITIHIDTNTEARRELYNSIKWTEKAPLAQHIFCEILSQRIGRLIVPDSTFNKYGYDGNWNYANFSYTTDNFLLKYSFKDRKIFLYGQSFSAIRVFRDLLAVKSPILPLHASCYYKDGKCFALTGDSGCGKSYRMLKELEDGALYIADDMLFVDKEGKVYCTDNLMRKYDKNGIKKKCYVESKNIYWGRCALDGIKILPESIDVSLSELRQPFPVKQLHSYWCLPFFIKESNMRDYIENQVRSSINFWQKQISEKNYV